MGGFEHRFNSEAISLNLAWFCTDHDLVELSIRWAEISSTRGAGEPITVVINWVANHRCHMPLATLACISNQRPFLHASNVNQYGTSYLPSSFHHRCAKYISEENEYSLWPENKTSPGHRCDHELVENTDVTGDLYKVYEMGSPQHRRTQT